MKLNISNKIDVKMDITLPFNVDNIKFKLSMISNVEDNIFILQKRKLNS